MLDRSDLETSPSRSILRDSYSNEIGLVHMYTRQSISECACMSLHPPFYELVSDIEGPAIGEAHHCISDQEMILLFSH